MEEKKVGLMSGTTDFTIEKKATIKCYDQIKEESPDHILK